MRVFCGWTHRFSSGARISALDRNQVAKFSKEDDQNYRSSAFSGLSIAGVGYRDANPATASPVALGRLLEIRRSGTFMARRASGEIGRRTGFRFQRLTAVRVRVSPRPPFSTRTLVQDLRYFPVRRRELSQPLSAESVALPLAY